MWQILDRRRLLLVGTHFAVYEIVLPEPTINAESKAFFPIRLQCDVGGLELVSKSFFVLASESLNNITKYSLNILDEWFLNPDMGLISVIQSATVRNKSLAAAFLRKHSMQGKKRKRRKERNLFFTLLFSTNQVSDNAKNKHQQSVVEEDDNVKGVRAKFVGGDNVLLRLIEKIYPVPVPIDNASLLIAVSQIFHFTHESIHWVGDSAHTEVLSGVMVPPTTEQERDKLHVYGSIFPCKGMYQHSNPRLKKPFETLCTTLKVILATNGLPKTWIENDGKVLEMTDHQVKSRQFRTYEEIFSNGDQVFNVNQVLEAAAKSVSITKAGALLIDYSVLIPVLVNTLDELHSFFSDVTRSRLKDMIGRCTDQLFSAQNTITELGNEIAEIEEDRAIYETEESVHGLASKSMINLLKVQYSQLPLHITQGSDFDCFISPSFDLYESHSEKEQNASETILDFAELIESDISIFRLCIKGLTGSGKTTICRYIAKEWAKGRKVFNGKFDMVFYIPLDIATTPGYADLAQVTIADIVDREFVRPNEDLTALLTDKSEVKGWLAAHSNRILWLMDGVESLEEYMDNPNNQTKGTAGSGMKLNPLAHDEQSPAMHNVKDLVLSLEASDDPENIVKHRIITTNLGGRSALSADLYLMIRLFSNTDIRNYVTKFFPYSEELLADEEGKFILDDSRGNTTVSGTEDERMAEMLQDEDSNSNNNNNNNNVSNPDQPSMSERAKKIWLNIEKLAFLSKDILHIPMNLEMVCASYLSDPEYHLGTDVCLSDLYGHLYVWLLNASGSYENVVPLEPHLFKIAYSALFKSKFACPTIHGKILNIVPREYRLSLTETRFFEQVSVMGKGSRFIHARVQEYLAARFIAEDEFTPEMLLRLRAKVINKNYHNVYFFVVGMLREDKERLNKFWDILLLDTKELGLLGSKGPSFVFKCFEETNFDRVIRSRVIEWFWEVFGTPRMQIWRSNFVVNLLELVIFKLSKKGAATEESLALKKKGIRAFGALGVENPRVIQMLVKAARNYPDAIAEVVQTFKDLSTTNLAVIPVLLDSLKTTDKENLKTSIGEMRRLIVPGDAQTHSSSERGGKSVLATAATRLIKIGMSNFDDLSDTSVLVEVLKTLAQWKWGDDSALPLLVKSLECAVKDVRKQAIHVVQYVDLLGPNVYYNEKLVGLLEVQAINFCSFFF